MKIGDVAKRLGVPASTIRYYEKEGLIERQQRVSGRRQFDERALLMLRFAQLAQAAGFTISETKGLLRSYAADPNPSGMWQPFVEAKRVAIRKQIGALQQMDAILGELLNCRCETMSDCVKMASGQNNRIEVDSVSSPDPCSSLRAALQSKTRRARSTK